MFVSDIRRFLPSPLDPNPQMSAESFEAFRSMVLVAAGDTNTCPPCLAATVAHISAASLCDEHSYQHVSDAAVLVTRRAMHTCIALGHVHVPCSLVILVHLDLLLLVQGALLRCCWRCCSAQETSGHSRSALHPQPHLISIVQLRNGNSSTDIATLILPF